VRPGREELLVIFDSGVGTGRQGIQGPPGKSGSVKVHVDVEQGFGHIVAQVGVPRTFDGTMGKSQPGGALGVRLARALPVCRQVKLRDQRLSFSSDSATTFSESVNPEIV
jgi:hypothetical protein